MVRLVEGHVCSFEVWCGMVIITAFPVTLHQSEAANYD